MSLDKDKYFKEELLSDDELVKVVASLQDELLRQQAKLADAYLKYEEAQRDNSRLIFNSELETAKVKEDKMQEYEKVQQEYSSFMHECKKQLKDLRKHI